MPVTLHCSVSKNDDSVILLFKDIYDGSTSATDIALMIPYFIAFILAFAAEPSPARCDLNHLEACRHVNQLFGSEGFTEALRRFVGDRRASWLYSDGSESSQILDVLGGPPDDKAEISPNLMRFSACRYQSCPEKGAVFLTPDGTIRSAAILHFSCDDECSQHYTLSILLHEKDTILIQAARDWAEEAIRMRNTNFPTLSEKSLETVEVLLRP